MKQDFITVKTFMFPADVTIVQTYMEMRGIEVYMKNLTSNRLAYTLGDIEMQVKTSDYESKSRVDRWRILAPRGLPTV